MRERGAEAYGQILSLGRHGSGEEVGQVAGYRRVRPLAGQPLELQSAERVPTTADYGGRRYPFDSSPLSNFDQTTRCLLGILRSQFDVLSEKVVNHDLPSGALVSRPPPHGSGFLLSMWFSESGGVLHLENPGAVSMPDLCPVHSRVGSVVSVGHEPPRWDAVFLSDLLTPFN